MQLNTLYFHLIIFTCHIKVKIGKYVNLLFSLEVNVRVCVGMYVLLYIYPYFSVDDHERYSNMKLLCLKI